MSWKPHIRYSISLFQYDPESKTFVGYQGQLRAMDGLYNYPFPSYRKQFNIVNTRTGNFRRFRLTADRKYQLEFKSEDGYTCIVYLAENGKHT